MGGFLKDFYINALEFYDTAKISHCSTISLDDISALNLSLVSGLEKMFLLIQMIRIGDRNELRMD